MKTIGKIAIGAGVVLGVGALACYGLKKLLEKADCCGCCNGECDCEGDGYMGTCERDCKCHEVKKVEPVADETAETEETPVAAESDFVAAEPTVPTAE